MDQYEQRMTEIKDEIYGVKVLRDAQRPDSARWDRFQQEIDGLTDKLTEWSDAAPELTALDGQIRAAEIRLSDAHRYADAGQGITTLAKVLGVAGIICLIISVTWMPSFWFPVATVVFLAGAVGAIVGGTRIRQGRAQAVDVAAEILASLRERRQCRVPSQAGVRSKPVTVGMFLEIEAARD